MSDRKRPYRMTKRAALEEQTRKRITEAAVELHETVGPARTTVSAIAERAGVRRSTVYRHFPNDEAMFDACSAHWRGANPPPDLGRWGAIDDPAERTRVALAELYAFYRRTHSMYASLTRDAALVPGVRRRLDDFYAYLDAACEVLIAGRGLRGTAGRRTRAAIGLALAFPTWRSLAHDQGLSDDEAVALMSRLVACAR